MRSRQSLTATLPRAANHGARMRYVSVNFELGGYPNNISDQVWGFEEIDGQRRHTRHLHFIGPKGEDIKARLVYDYCESNGARLVN